MSGKSPAAAAAAGSSSSAASIDTLSIQRLMSRLLLRPPYLDTNSYLSHTLDDFLLSDDAALDLDLDLSDDDDGLDDELKFPSLTDAPRRGRLAKEEAKLEKEIIRIIHSPAAAASLKPNSGHSVAIGDHNVCVGSHEDPGSEYRIWEWHGHIMFFDDEDGYSPEYVYGNYFERVGDKKEMNKVELVVEEEEGSEDEMEEVAKSGLRDLIADPKDLPWGAGGRVLHRSSLNGGLGAARIVYSDVLKEETCTHFTC